VRWAVPAVAGVGLVVAGLATLSLARAASDLRAARDQLDAVPALVEEGRLGEAEDRLDAAYAHASTANGRLYGNPRPRPGRRAARRRRQPPVAAPVHR
jgi:hypothetical protein